MEITVILPIHKYSDEYNEMLKTSASSFRYSGKDKQATLMVVARKEDFEKYSFENRGDIQFVEVGDSESTSFQHLVNKGVSACKTEYFSILEIDDWYTEIAFSTAEEYENSEYKASVMMFLSELVDYKTKENGSVGYLNEAVLARGFSEETGWIDSASIQDFFNFNLTGSIFNTADFKEVGMLKESIKISFWYEFMLRALKYGKKFFVMPKVGYIHMLGRPDSLSVDYSENISEEESEWWIELAKKEYFYKNDRNKTYEEE